MRCRAAVVLVGVLVAGCGDDGDGVIDTAEECQEAGGHVVANPGPIATCEEDEDRIGGIIPGGIEGSICCRAK